MYIRKLKLDDISYISIMEIKKNRKKHYFFRESHRGYWMNYSKYVYRKGKTFNIRFHLKDKSEELIYYGWLYSSRTEKRIDKQVNKFHEIARRFTEYKKLHYKFTYKKLSNQKEKINTKE